MPIVCPDPDILTSWRHAMTVTGVCLLLIIPLALALIARAHPHGRLPWLVTLLSTLFAGGVSVASLILSNQLNHAFAVVAQWFSSYPAACIPGAEHWDPGYIINIERFAQQAVDPLEQLAQVDMILAVVALVALVACVFIWGRRRTTPEAEPAAA